MQSPTFFDNLRESLYHYFTFPGSWILISLILLAGIALCAVAGYFIFKLILQGVSWIVQKSETDWDDDLINDKFLTALSQLAPAVIIAWMLPRCFDEFDILSATIHILTSFYIVVASVYAANTFLDNLLAAFTKRRRFRPYAVKGIFQMVKLILIAIGAIICISLLIGKSPVAILTALGASAAILMLVFRDTILGLVASVQLTANRMVQKGDWIVVPKHGANGEVTDISLTTVKVRNWDNSISTIPPYSLVSESFQNFTAMQNSGARRISRAIYIDMQSIRYCTPGELEALQARGWLKGIDMTDAETMVNLSLLRNYLEQWLAKRPEVRADLIYMVRQLPPTPQGLPLELYFFTHQTSWKPYEHIQADIFDHVYAIVGRFGLRLYQAPSGTDLLALTPHTPLPSDS